jgi:predicted metal-dependent peptidase
MSDKLRKSVSKDTLEKEFVPASERRQALESALFDCVRHQPFMGSVLQILDIKYDHSIPTAGIMFNSDKKVWEMYINPKFFCHKMNNVVDENGNSKGGKARSAILLHELSHITHKHPFRVPFLKIDPQKRMVMNVAADMAINQFIPHLPAGCSECPQPDAKYEPCKNEDCPGKAIRVEDFYDEDESGKRTPWPKNMPMEFYYEKLLARLSENEDGDGQGDGEGGEGGGIPETLDEHMWDQTGDEKDMLEATENLIKRAMIKEKCSYDKLPGSIKDLLTHIDKRKVELDYRRMILSAIKKRASGHERKSTWSRKSRRFGNKAPGTTVGDLPKLDIYLDTSGSISTEELNEALIIVDNFLKAGSRKCTLNLFHTDNYYREEYKLGQRLGDDGIQSKVQSGGTDLESSLKAIYENNSDLSIFVTDGYYSDVDVEKWTKGNEKFPQCLFIISKGGSEEHPLKRLGDTVKVPS